MHYGALKPLDIANGPGVRVSLFVSGCRNHCEGCFQPETWAFDYGEKWNADALFKLLEFLDHPNVKGLSILGGDPFEPENVKTVSLICLHVRHKYPDKTIWVWTGYLYEDLIDGPPSNKLALMSIDVLVDGPFVKDLKDFRLKYRGSSNQRVIDVKKSLAAGEVILYEEV